MRRLLLAGELGLGAALGVHAAFDDAPGRWNPLSRAPSFIVAPPPLSRARSSASTVAGVDAQVAVWANPSAGQLAVA